jgi:hypothetical protein
VLRPGCTRFESCLTAVLTSGEKYDYVTSDIHLFKSSLIRLRLHLTVSRLFHITAICYRNRQFNAINRICAVRSSPKSTVSGCKSIYRMKEDLMEMEFNLPRVRSDNEFLSVMICHYSSRTCQFYVVCL